MLKVRFAKWGINRNDPFKKKKKEAPERTQPSLLGSSAPSIPNTLPWSLQTSLQTAQDLSAESWHAPQNLLATSQTAQDLSAELWQSPQNLLATTQPECLDPSVLIHAPLQTIHLEGQYATYGGLPDSMSASQTHQPGSFETMESSVGVNSILGLPNLTTESRGSNTEHFFIGETSFSEFLN
jgi:hypothetical protein